MNNFFATPLKQKDAFQGLRAKLFGNFSWLFAGTAGKLIIGFIATLYLARVLGPQGFGQIAFAQAILAYFILITDFGLQTLGTREIAVASEGKSRIVGKILTIRFVLVIASLGILIIFAPFFTPSTTTKYLLVIFSFTLIPMGANLAWFFRGLEKMMLIGVSDVLQVGFYLALLLMLVKSPDQLFYVPAIFIGGHMLSTLFLSGIYAHRWGLPKLSTSIVDNWKFLSIAAPVIVTQLLHQIYFNMDIWMLGFYRSETEVGFYNAAYRVIFAIIMINTVFMQAIYPTFSRLYRRQPLEVSKLLKKTLSLSMIFAIPIGIAGTILSHSLIATLFGTAFANSTLAFQILVWSASLAFLGANYGYCLVACHQQKTLAFAAGIGTAVNIVLNFLLIPSHGIIGACLATIIAQVVMVICESIAFSLRISPTFPSAILALKASAAGLVMGLVLFYLNSYFNLFLLIIIGVVVYFSILWLLGRAQLFKLLSFRIG